MPYKDPARQREACKINMQKLRAKRKQEKDNYEERKANTL
jgi:hypothetical protein